jgi:DNA adenine methylase
MAVATPFVKFAGGKRQLLPVLMPLFVSRPFQRYHEPFVGGGAAFFAIRSTFRGPAYLSDTNEDLLDAYRAVRDDLSMLGKLLEAHQSSHSELHYYEVRKHPKLYDHDVASRAARMVYLNRACFNGLYRVNSKGEFNVPFGKHEKVVFDWENLRACSTALKNTDVRVEDFRQSALRVKAGDLWYADPPYVPVSKTSNFVGYGKDGFGESDQEDLAEVFCHLDSIGARLVLSNADCKPVRDLYQGFNIQSVSARRSVNSKSNGRGPVGEVIVTNFE